MTCGLEAESGVVRGAMCARYQSGAVWLNRRATVRECARGEGRMDPSEEIKTSGSLTEALANDLVVDPSYVREQLRSEQSIPMAVLTGGVAALIGAIGWAIVTATTHFQIGFMAVGVGFLVGLA